MLTFWRDGFSVDDGPLRTGNSEEDKSFIAAVRKGSVNCALPSLNSSQTVCCCAERFPRN